MMECSIGASHLRLNDSVAEGSTPHFERPRASQVQLAAQQSALEHRLKLSP
jgi:hypothetical protein